MKDFEEDIGVGWHSLLLCNLIGANPHKGIFRKRRESVAGLVGQNASVSQKQYTRAS
jgi:hypothetical protein